MELYERSQTERRKVHIRRWVLIVTLVAAAAFLACILFCCRANTANITRMEKYTILTSLFAGWFVIFSLTVIVLPSWYAVLHEENVLRGERSTVTGVITLEPEVLQIPKSISICKVVVNNGEESSRISVRSDKAGLLAGLEGKKCTLHTVHSYIAAIEESHETA